MNRRQLLFGSPVLLGTTLIGISPVKAAKPVKSVIFPIIGKNEISFTIKNKLVNGECSIFIEKNTEYEANLRNINDDPDWLYANMCTNHIIKKPTTTMDMLFEIERLSNRVARASRRGKGNNLIMHKNMYDKLKTEPKFEFFIDRFNVNIVEDKKWEDKIFAFYRNIKLSNIDVAGHIFLNEKVGEYSLLFTENNHNNFAYGKMLTLR